MVEFVNSVNSFDTLDDFVDFVDFIDFDKYFFLNRKYIVCSPVHWITIFLEVLGSFNGVAVPLSQFREISNPIVNKIVNGR